MHHSDNRRSQHVDVLTSILLSICDFLSFCSLLNRSYFCSGKDFVTIKCAIRNGKQPLTKFKNKYCNKYWSQPNRNADRKSEKSLIFVCFWVFVLKQRMCRMAFVFVDNRYLKPLDCLCTVNSTGMKRPRNLHAQQRHSTPRKRRQIKSSSMSSEN